MAAAAVPALVSLGSKLLGGLLGAHSARLKGATNENEAADQVVPAFDQDIQEIVTAWNSGQINETQGFNAVAGVDASIKQYLKSQVGKPGTAWQEFSSSQDGRKICNKSCTVGCCFYWADLKSVFEKLEAIFTGKSTLSISAGYYTLNIPQVFPSKYSGFSRPGYAVQVRSLKQNPPMSAAIASGNPVAILSGGLAGAESQVSGVIHSITSHFGFGTKTPLGTVQPNSNPIATHSITRWLLVGLAVVAVLLFMRSR